MVHSVTTSAYDSRSGGPVADVGESENAHGRARLRTLGSQQMKPEHVQLRRSKGWRMPPNTVKAGRSGKWGNPFKEG